MALKENEKFFVKSWFAETNEDSYEQGEIGCGTSWSYNDLQFDTSKPFDSVQDALKAVSDCNGFSWERKNWEGWFKEYGEDLGRFDGGFMVNVNSEEASENELVAWRKNECRLWSCRLTVNLEVRPIVMSRELTPDEAKNF